MSRVVEHQCQRTGEFVQWESLRTLYSSSGGNAESLLLHTHTHTHTHTAWQPEKNQDVDFEHLGGSVQPMVSRSLIICNSLAGSSPLSLLRGNCGISFDACLNEPTAREIRYYNAKALMVCVGPCTNMIHGNLVCITCDRVWVSA